MGPTEGEILPTSFFGGFLCLGVENPLDFSISGNCKPYWRGSQTQWRAHLWIIDLGEDRGLYQTRRKVEEGSLGWGRPALMAEVTADVKCFPMGLGLATQGVLGSQGHECLPISGASSAPHQLK